MIIPNISITRDIDYYILVASSKLYLVISCFQKITFVQEKCINLNIWYQISHFILFSHQFSLLAAEDGSGKGSALTAAIAARMAARQ